MMQNYWYSTHDSKRSMGFVVGKGQSLGASLICCFPFDESLSQRSSSFTILSKGSIHSRYRCGNVLTKSCKSSKSKTIPRTIGSNVNVKDGSSSRLCSLFELLLLLLLLFFFVFIFGFCLSLTFMTVSGFAAPDLKIKF